MEETSMILFPLFLFVLIINLLWFTTFLVEIHSESTVAGLNVAMALSWVVFLYLYWKRRIKKKTSLEYDVLVEKKETTHPGAEVESIEMSEWKVEWRENEV